MSQGKSVDPWQRDDDDDDDVRMAVEGAAKRRHADDAGHGCEPAACRRRPSFASGSPAHEGGRLPVVAWVQAGGAALQVGVE